MAWEALIGVIVGFGLAQVAEIVKRKQRVTSHKQALRAEVDICRQCAEGFLNDGVESPLYRLPMTSFQVSFPILLAESALSHDGVRSLSQFFGKVEEINRGFDNANEIRLGRAKPPGENIKSTLKQEYDRLEIKANALIDDLHEPAIRAVT